MSIRKLTCYIVVCDGCGIAFDELVGDYTVHFDSPEAGEAYVTEESTWLITVNGQHMCECCWAKYACTEAGHIYTAWQPCGCKGEIPDHRTHGCGLWRACHRRGCLFTEDATLASLPTIDEPRRSR
ncbi:hypothetical protein [Pseudonocardia humida]|uniref:Uncharacterized protein n=1 Tax=Pseudonocardia humida TaxID=2800819 RepID=A0ABT1A364_9PSEU|nr:hypothetical protein [Pseudonocardia humida]MCO1657437.1 hypothetical protein [Pseudonocardia humida]